MPGILAAGILLCAFAFSAAAEIYTWTDANGVVHFTDSPPPDKPQKTVDVAAPVTLPMASNIRQHKRVSGIHRQVKGLLASDRKGDARRTRSRAKAAARQKKTCANYRRQLDQIQSQLRVGYGNSKGNSLRGKRRRLSKALSRECILR
ncbi:MAG: DUF4124 domain-containing protein [Marinobacter sp.]|uniref:DUF4124 domain-containing protein n=1 Tax=Marinobacter sp. TaxID=50741 RepID=UPI003F9B9849